MGLSFPLAAVMIPEDILMEILVRLPAYSLMRFKRVSKAWYSLISSRYFTNLFFKFSSSTNLKRRVFAHWNHSKLFSSSLCNLDATSSFLQLNPDLTFLGNGMQNGDYSGYNRLDFVNAIRGLMCFRDERFHPPPPVRIVNFTTRQILILPEVESNILMKSDDGIMGTSRSKMGLSPSLPWNYLGYDPVNDEYKVLSTISSFDTVNEVRSETQVFVLGDGASWRNTKSLTSPPPLHRPFVIGGISINGVLYYGALSHANVHVLMSFDFHSEEFNLIKFHGDYYLLVNLMNYQDQVAVFDSSRIATECILDLWVLEDAVKSKWSHKFFVLPYTMLNTYGFNIRGTSWRGEIALWKGYGDQREIKYFIYDFERNDITRVVAIKSSYIQGRQFEINIWDDVESIMYLEA